MNTRTHLFILPALLGSVFVFCCGLAPLPKGKTTGKYYLNAGIHAEGKLCMADSTDGTLVRFDQPHENPLFESKAPNMVHLLIWFRDSVKTGFRYELPDPRVEVCYWEQGDLLMFHTNKPKGWIEFDPNPKPSRLSGKMELKLVEPDHNMSNSDYHYMGGAFALTLAKLDGR